MKQNQDKKTKFNFVIEDMTLGGIRVSNSEEVMAQLVMFGMDHAELLLDGKTQFLYKTMPFKVYWLDNLPLKDVLFSGIFREARA